nr:hypothetical protein B0A51_11408 [Rachicladosporium sp. CCFEE 5018]
MKIDDPAARQNGWQGGFTKKSAMMARSGLAIGLTAGLLFLLATLGLLEIIRAPVQSHVGVADSTENATPPQSGSTAPLADQHGHQYLLGVGKGDITGPVVEINFMGYADPAQLGTGLRQRLYSRAFIIGDEGDTTSRIVYLVLDTQAGDTAVRHGILTALSELGEKYAMYGPQNIAVTGTHSHSGPGAWLNYLLPQITSRGFNKPSYQAIVDGAVASIQQAHESLQLGTLSFGSIQVFDANINRSPYAYLANPEAERLHYEHDVDKTLALLRFQHYTNDGLEDVGVLTWFPVHGTSMLGNNTLVTGDNKGVAADLFEKMTNDSSFVAGFSQSNVGDTSPNVLGAYCESGDEAGQMCDFETSLCGNKTQPCHGRGPYFGRDDAGTASSFEIGRRQYAAAFELWKNASAFTAIEGKAVKSIHQFADFSNFGFELLNGTMAQTCPAALGQSFAAGTTDGPGAFDFKQGSSNANPLWSLIGNRIHKPNETQNACHGPKAILLDVGESGDPYAWSPNIVDIQVLRVGQLFMIIAPGEATTMSGRRWKAAVKFAAVDAFSDLATEPLVVLGGPANTYAHYIATPEEYSIQRYEGASTLYGPHTLDAHINSTLALLPALDASKASFPRLERGPPPPINIDASLNFITPVIVDRAPLFKSFGDMVTDVSPRYIPGDTVAATFVGANPRNDFRLEQTFAAVEKYDSRANTWTQMRDDSDWSLVYEWKRTSTVIGSSQVTLSWETKWENGAWRRDNTGVIDETHGGLMIRDVELRGRYRLKYYGDAKSFGGSITPFEGVSGVFDIT